MMNKLLERMRHRVQRFLGLNALALMPGDEPYHHIGDQLLRMHRIFGDPARVTRSKIPGLTQEYQIIV